MTNARILPLLLLAACQTNLARDSQPKTHASGPGSKQDQSLAATASADSRCGGAFLQVLELAPAPEHGEDGDSRDRACLRLRSVIHVQPRALNLPYDLYLTVSILPEDLGIENIRLLGSGGETNVARLSDDTVRVRVGSLQPVTTPVDFTLSVPYLSNGSLPLRLRLTTKVELIDTVTGAEQGYGISVTDQLEVIRKRYKLDRFDSEDMSTLWESVHSGVYRMFTGILESRAPDLARPERLWLDLACAQDGYTTRWLRVPKISRPGLPTGQSIIMRDDGDRTRIELDSSPGKKLDLAAYLEITDGRSLHAEKILALPNGTLRLTFPSLRALKLSHEEVLGMVLYELAPAGEQSGTQLEVARYDDLRLQSDDRPGRSQGGYVQERRRLN